MSRSCWWGVFVSGCLLQGIVIHSWLSRKVRFRFTMDCLICRASLWPDLATREGTYYYSSAQSEVSVPIVSRMFRQSYQSVIYP